MRIKRFRPVYIIAAAVLAGAAFVPVAMASGATSPAPVQARITGAVIPGSRSTAPYAEPAGLPSRQQQVKVLAAALAYMRANYKTLYSQGTPGVADIFDYGIGSLWLKGIDGAGTTVAVIEGWDYPQIGSVVAGFDKTLHLPNPQIETIFPAGKLPRQCPPGMVKLGSYGSCDAWQGELTLDVITAHMIAPYAKIVISATPADTQENDDPASNVAPPEMMKALEVISSQHLANVISISDGTGETTYSYGDAEILAQDPGELAAAAAGIPVLVASGDCGVVQNLAVANGQCEDVSTTPDTAAWDDSPWVTAVGGSVPNMSAQTPKKLGPDPVWNTPPFSEGAGFSSVYPRPSYQDGLDPSPMRSVPDITMDAQDGTSEAAPMLAGVLALTTQVNHGNVGPINPALYRVLGPAGARDGIADVVSGNDSYVNSNGQLVVPGFTAGRGFDVASGWGTVYAPRFVPSLAAATRTLGQEAAARAQARDELTGLERGGIELTRTNTGFSYLLGTGFLPGHPVQLRIDGKLIATLTVNSLGDVTYMIDPALLKLSNGRHTVTLTSLLITETATLVG
jgi:subtilase family serine protease